MHVTVATWNVNSVKQRLSHLTDWLRRDRPDIALLQELKCTKDVFPYMEIEELGYNIALVGEKSYNGVAILSRFPLDDVCNRLPGDEADTQARYIEAVVSLPSETGKNVGAIRVASVYVPNGQEVGSDKFRYKLAFFERLRARLRHLLQFQELLVAGGDYNVAPFPQDVFDAKALDGSVCYHPQERARFRSILHSGLYDAYRLRHPATDAPDSGGFTWWDYRAGSWQMNKGMRIDHLLVSPQAADCLAEVSVLKSMRALERASDHAPVAGKFSL